MEFTAGTGIAQGKKKVKYMYSQILWSSINNNGPIPNLESARLPGQNLAIIKCY